MPLTVTPVNIAASVVGSLPDTLPAPPSGASPELMEYHNGLIEWYSAFLVAYSTQQKQILSKFNAA